MLLPLSEPSSRTAALFHAYRTRPITSRPRLHTRAARSLLPLPQSAATRTSSSAHYSVQPVCRALRRGAQGSSIARPAMGCPPPLRMRRRAARFIRRTCSCRLQNCSRPPRRSRATRRTRAGPSVLPGSLRCLWRRGPGVPSRCRRWRWLRVRPKRSRRSLRTNSTNRSSFWATATRFRWAVRAAAIAGALQSRAPNRTLRRDAVPSFRSRSHRCSTRRHPLHRSHSRSSRALRSRIRRRRRPLCRSTRPPPRVSLRASVLFWTRRRVRMRPRNRRRSRAN